MAADSHAAVIDVPADSADTKNSPGSSTCWLPSIPLWGDSPENGDLLMPTHGKWAGPPARAVSESRAAGVSHPENDPIHVLSASPFRADHDVIERCLQRQWTLRRAFTLPAARAILQDGGRIPLVVCDCGLRPGSWRDLLGEMSSVSDPPLFIVTSQCADDYLWAEALNLGAYDVLAKPFDDSELARALHSAWARWSSRAGHPRTADHRRSGNRAPRPAA